MGLQADFTGHKPTVPCPHLQTRKDPSPSIASPAACGTSLCQPAALAVVLQTRGRGKPGGREGRSECCPHSAGPGTAVTSPPFFYAVNFLNENVGTLNERTQVFCTRRGSRLHGCSCSQRGHGEGSVVGHLLTFITAAKGTWPLPNLSTKYQYFLGNLQLGCLQGQGSSSDSRYILGNV